MAALSSIVGSDQVGEAMVDVTLKQSWQGPISFRITELSYMRQTVQGKQTEAEGSVRLIYSLGYLVL